MAWWNPFSWGDDDDEEQQKAAVTNAVRPFKSLTEINTGQTLNDIIQAALTQGKGIGYPSDYTSRVTSPVVAQREYNFTKKELPTLSGELSGRGLGRSSIAGQQIGEATAQKERDINSYLADAYATDEAQKKADQARYENLGMTYTGAEATQRGNYSADDLLRVLETNKIGTAYNTRDTQDINQLIGTALKYAAPAALAPFTGGASLAMYGAYGIGDLTKALTQVNEATNATPFTKRVKNTAYN